MRRAFAMLRSKYVMSLRFKHSPEYKKNNSESIQLALKLRHNNSNREKQNEPDNSLRKKKKKKSSLKEILT